MILERKHRGSRTKTGPNLTFFTTDATWIGLGFNLGHQGERPANCMIRGTRTKGNSNTSPPPPPKYKTQYQSLQTDRQSEKI